MFLIKLRIVIFFLLMLLYIINSLMRIFRNMIFWLMKMFEDTVFWLRLLKIFLYDIRLSAVNLIFDWIVACNDNTQIKHSVLRSVSLIWQLYCLPALSMTVASLLTRVDIRSSIYHADLSSTEVELELLLCVDVDQNCLRLDLQSFSMFL